MDGQIPDGERRKVVTVVFCDLVGSTELGQQLDPEATRRIIARYFDAMRVALERHGGTVEKFIGDAVMAVFGVPTLHEDDALRAVRAAIDMRAALDSLNERLAADELAPLAIRIGIETGEAAFGEITGGQRLATGPALNLAARLEQAAVPGEILLGPETMTLVRRAVVVEPRPPIEAKGFSLPVDAWRLLALEPGGQAIERRADTPFIGRIGELTALGAAFDDVVASRSCALVTVEGAPGIGKSRLSAELARSLGNRAQVLVGRCLPYGERVTYAALGDALAQSVPPLVDLLATAEEGPLIRSLVERALAGGEDAGSPDETAWAFRRAFEAVAARTPVVLVVDDLHWAEPTLIDLLEYLVTFSGGEPLLLVCLTRHDLFETRPSWAAPRPNATLVRLDPLSVDETRRLVDGLVDLPGVDPEVRTRVVDRAAGNPLFVEQLLAMLADRAGAVGREADDARDIPVPPTIRALLAARVDALPAAERAVVQAAAIEGWIFRRSAVGALLEADIRSGAGAHLMSLVRKEFVRPERDRIGGDDTFRFNHVLIRDAAYEAMSKTTRAALHERYADWLEGQARSGEDPSEAVGYHLERAHGYRLELGPADPRADGIVARAGAALGVAGRRASARGDANAAVRLLRRAAELLHVNPAARVDLLPDLGLAVRENGDLAGAERVLDEAIDESRRLGDERNELRAEIERWRVRSQAGGAAGPGGPRSTADRAIALFERLGDDANLSAAWFLRALHSTDWDSTVGAYERARDYAVAAGDDRRLVDVWNEYGGAMLFGPTPVPEVIAFLDAEMAWAKAKGYPGVEADALLGGPYCYPLIGRWDEARAMSERSKTLSEELGISYGLAEACWAAAQMELLGGDVAAAEREMRRSLRLHEQTGAVRYVAMVRAHLAHVLLEQDRVDEAVALIDSALALGAGDGRRFEVYWRTARAKAMLRSSGDPTEAERLAREAVAIVAATNDLNLHAAALAMLGDVLAAIGDPPGAFAVLEQAAEVYDRKGNMLLAARTRDTLDELRGEAPRRHRTDTISA